MTKEGWQNNRFNKKVYEKIRKQDNSFPFSLEDIDGVVRFFYDENGETKTRLIIYEVKSLYEPDPKPAQLLTLKVLNESIDWKKFDSQSGVFLIRELQEDFEKTEISKMEDSKFVKIAEVPFDYYWQWFCNLKPIEYPKIECPKCKNIAKIVKENWAVCQACFYEFYV